MLLALPKESPSLFTSLPPGLHGGGQETHRRRAALAREKEARRCKAQAREDWVRTQRPATPPPDVADRTAAVLERVLERGRVGGVDFNPAAALRGPGGWRIVARMARTADVVALVATLDSELVTQTCWHSLLLLPFLLLLFLLLLLLLLPTALS